MAEIMGGRGLSRAAESYQIIAEMGGRLGLSRVVASCQTKKLIKGGEELPLVVKK